MHRRLHGAERIALAVVLIVILAITFWPTRVDAPFDRGLERVLAAGHGIGLPGFVDYDFLQNAANVVLFVPLGALVASVLMPTLWWCAGVLGLSLSLVVEGSQAVFLPDRVASAGDLAANTGGALLGAAVVAAVRAVRSRRGARLSRGRGCVKGKA